MKINFDHLSSNLKSSLYKTQASLPSTYEHLSFTQISPQKKHQQSYNNNYQSYTNNYQNLYKSQISTHSAQTYSSIFNTNSKNHLQKNHQTKKSPKKFANLKTMEQMKTFIQAMNEAQNIDQPKYFQKQKQQLKQKNDSQSLKLSFLKPSTHKNQKDFVQTLTNRLYYQSQRRKTNVTDANCKKKACKDNISTIKRHQIQDQKQFTGQPQRQHPVMYKSLIQMHRSLQISQQKSLDSSFSTRSKQKDDVHFRLYEDYKQRQVRNDELRRQIQFNSKSLRNSFLSNHQDTKQNSEYTKNFRSFYERLQELVQWKNNKHKIYDKLQLSTSFLNTNKMRNKSKSKQSIKSPEELDKKMVILSTRNTKCSKGRCHQKEQQIFNQLNKSRQKLDLNTKSVSIIQAHQKSIVQQIKGLFFNKKTGNIKVNSNKVSKLSNFQFDTLFKLIIQIEADFDHLKNQKMLQKLILNYYQNLDTAKKQQLRRLHILKSCNVHKKDKQVRRQQNLNEAKNKRILIQNFKSSREKNVSGVQSKYGVERKDYWKDLIDYV